MTPQTELDGDMGDAHVGLLARLMGQGFRKVTAKLGASGVTLIFINQIRHKIGVTYGSPETTTGGNALKFYASVRLDVRRIGSLKEVDADGNPLGNEVRVKVVKNKVAPPFREAVLHLYFGYGFPEAADIFNVGVASGIIEKSGSWFNYQGERLGQGSLNSKNYIQATPGMLDRIRAEILAKKNNAPS
jgi:recombination protein RecA